LARDSDSDKSQRILNTSLKLIKETPLFDNIPIIALPAADPEEIENGLRKGFFFKGIAA
jgi:hypothetical protein